MDVSDRFLWQNRDWDPSYLSTIFDMDFHDFNDLWISNTQDSELVKVAEHVEKYCPIVEDISMDDTELCNAVEAIEERYFMVFCHVCFIFDSFKFYLFGYTL